MSYVGSGLSARPGMALSTTHANLKHETTVTLPWVTLWLESRQVHCKGRLTLRQGERPR